MSGRPIGVYDSGVGGLTVSREVWRVLPQERILYLGDTARVPYGGRPARDIERFARQAISYLEMRGCKLVVVACNTTSALALDGMTRDFAVPLIGVLRPGAYAASKASRTGRIGVIATEGTVRSGAYERAIRQLLPHAEVFSRACPRLVPLVEAGRAHSGEAVEALREYLEPLVDEDIDVLVLGCTHYPYLEDEIRRIVGPDVTIVDPAGETVKAAAALLAGLGLLSETRSGPDEFLVTGEPEKFASVARELLGRALPSVRRVSLPEHASLRQGPTSCQGVEGVWPGGQE